MGCGLSSSRGTLSSGMLGQKHIMCPELRQDIHEDLGVTLVACSLKGWRKTQEDTSSIVINLGGRKDMLGVGVFDGHSGPEASRYVAANLWNEVTKTTEWAVDDIDGALRAAFFAVDENMRTEKVSHGTTAVIAVLTPSYLYVANCGDSRAVLCKGGVATALSTDHKPNVYTEMARVVRCGGQVMTGEFGGVSRVTAPGAMVAMATSRSLGDFHFKRRYNSEPGEQVVSPAAEVTCQRRTEEDEFLVLGTDGVWDVLSNQEVSDILRSSERLRRPSRSSDIATPSSILETHLGPSWKTRRAGTITMGGSRPSPARTRYYSGADGDSVRDAATHSVTHSVTTEPEPAVTESSFRGRRGSSFSTSTRSSPAFIRLFTPNLVRLRTPTSPEPPKVRRVEVGGVQVNVVESEEGKQETEEGGCASDEAAAAAAAGSDAAPVNVAADRVEEGAIAEEVGINEEASGENGRPADSISRDFVVTEEVEASGDHQTLPMSPASYAQNLPPAHGAWEGGGGRQMASRSSSLSGSDSNGDSDSDSYFEGSEFGGGVTAIAAVLAMAKRKKPDAHSHGSTIATSPVTTKHAGAVGGMVSPSSEAKHRPLEGLETEDNVCGVDEGGKSSCLSGPASASIPAVGSHDGASASIPVARNSEEEGNDSRLASDVGLISSTGSKGVAAAEPEINPGTSPAPAPTSCPPTSSGACQEDVTPSSGNTPNPVNLTPFRNSGTPGGSSGSAPKTPSMRTTPPIYRSLRTPGVGNIGTPGRRGSSNSGTPNSWGSGRGGGSGGSRVGSMRRGSVGGMGSLFHRNSGGSSLSLSMTAKDSKGVIGAVRGVLDRALQLGSQDNMTLIAVDLRGFLEPSPPPSTSSVQ